MEAAQAQPRRASDFSVQRRQQENSGSHFIVRAESFLLSSPKISWYRLPIHEHIPAQQDIEISAKVVPVCGVSSEFWLLF